MRPPENHVELTDYIRAQLTSAFANNFKVNSEFSVTREKGYYGICYAMTSAKLKAALSIDQELLILISTFEDQQFRTIQTARELIDESDGRLDPKTFIVIHRDQRGNNKLKKWGRAHGLAVLLA